jgi:hypothetical protein
MNKSSSYTAILLFFLSSNAMAMESTTSTESTPFSEEKIIAYIHSILMQNDYPVIRYLAHTFPEDLRPESGPLYLPISPDRTLKIAVRLAKILLEGAPEHKEVIEWFTRYYAEDGKTAYETLSDEYSRGRQLCLSLACGLTETFQKHRQDWVIVSIVMYTLFKKNFKLLPILIEARMLGNQFV